MSGETIERKPITMPEINKLISILGLGAWVVELRNVDLKRGRSNISKDEVWMWTKKGHKITLMVCSDGGFIASQSKEPDPDRPAPLEVSK